MMTDDNEIVNKNAAQRKTYVGYVFDEGEKIRKETILAGLPKNWSTLHRKGYIHIHDLDAYGLTYNCLTFNFLKSFPYSEYADFNDSMKIISVFDYIKEIVSKVSNEQSGGMGFANFDTDLAIIIEKMNIKDSTANREIMADCISSLIRWCSRSHERMGQVSYYVTLNIGLGICDVSRYICEILLDSFYNSPATTIRPNIVFKVKHGINADPGDSNHYLLKKALLCSAKKMIPTYLICDCELNQNCNPEKLSIMGCRTRVVDDLFGEPGAIGRGNICNISINLPRIALDVCTDDFDGNKRRRIQRFKDEWLLVADSVTKILIDRYKKTILCKASDFPTVSSQKLWVEEFVFSGNSENVFRHGTLSIGFIGLSEAIQLLCGEKYYKSRFAGDVAVDIVRFMRVYVDRCRDDYQLNFSLLATSGEQITGRFEGLDRKEYPQNPFYRGFYTNSFHVNVDSELTAMEKIAVEGPFHKYCNGGCITYVELNESPIGNDEALMELIHQARACNVHYLGFNFKLDVCEKCGFTGVFDVCSVCGSRTVLHIRRVSGYLEDSKYFTSGKKCEEKSRMRNGL